MKPVALLIASLTIFLFAACGNAKEKVPGKQFSTEQTGCIKRIIAEDDRLGKIRNHACEKLSLSQAIDGYINTVGEVSTQNCPGAFTASFADHLLAWAEMKKLTDGYPSLRGEMHVLFGQLEKGKDSTVFKQLQKAIWDTWARIENAMKE